jgi:hypothetical protein
MKSMHSEETEDRLKRVKMNPSPELERRMDALWVEAVGEDRRGVSVTPGLFRRRVLRLGAPIAAMCMVLLVGWYLMSGHDAMPSAYAELMQAARNSQEAEWVHATGTMGGEPVEVWSTIHPFRSFFRRGGRVEAVDAQAHREYKYDAATNTLTIHYVPEAPSMVRQASSYLSAVLTQLERARQEGLCEITKDRVPADGRECDVYTIIMKDENATVGTLTVDLSSQRIMSITSQAAGNVAPGPVDLAFDYPETGPADIYELGVPRDAKVVRQIPTEGLLELYKKVEEARGRFAPTYYAAIGRGSVPVDGSGSLTHLTLIHKRNGRYRIADYMNDPLNPIPFPPEEPADLERYVERLKLSRVAFGGPSSDSPGVSIRLSDKGELLRREFRRGGVLLHGTVEDLTWSRPVSWRTAAILPAEENPDDHLIGTRYTTQGFVSKNGDLGAFPGRYTRYWDPSHDYARASMESLSDAHAPWLEDPSRLAAANYEKEAKKFLTTPAKMADYRRRGTEEITDYGRTKNGRWYARRVVNESQDNLRNRLSRTLTIVHLDTEREIPERLLDPSTVTAETFQAPARGTASR